MRLPILCLLAALAGGCGRQGVKVYEVPRSEAVAASAQPPGMPAGHPDVAGTRPGLKWTLPAGWQEGRPSALRVASFTVPGKGGAVADVAVIPLPAGGNNLDLVNMWRSEVGLAAVQTLPAAETVTAGGEAGELFDLAGEGPGPEGQSRGRVLVAMVRRDGMNWFFKMKGPEPLVGEQRPAFLEFLKSVSFTAEGPRIEFAGNPHVLSANTAHAAVETASHPEWTVPPGWQEAPAGQFLSAKFLVGGDGNAEAAVNVSQSPGDGGGLLANINRWRQQLQLPPIAQEELGKQTAPVEIAGGKATFVDMSGTDPRNGRPARLVAAVVPQSAQTWFYKLMGDASLVEREKDAFTRFVQSAQYPHVP